MAASGSTSRFAFTPELADDRQAAVLYSPFRDKGLNLHSWNRKMNFWENLLLKTFMERRVISFDLSKLPEMFERNGLTPKCLPTVVDQMKRSGQLQPVSQYQKSNGWLSWGFNTLVKQPVYWGVTQFISSQKKDSDMLVCPNVLKQIAKEVLELHQSHVQFGVADSLVSLTQFKESCQHLVHDAKDFEIVLTFLERENHIALSQTNEGEVVVKFRREGESRVCFEQIDLNIYSIKVAVEKLEKDMDVLSSRIEGHLEEAKVHIKVKRKRMALMCLKRKASLQKLMDRKAGSLTMLQEILQKIEDANTNEMVVKACEAGVQAMKKLNAEVTVEKAEAIVDDVHEAMAVQEEVNGILSSEMSAVDEEELERSLEELLKGDTQATAVGGHSSQAPLSRVISKGSVSERTADAAVEDDIAAAFLSLEIDDLDLPEVPSHSPQKWITQDKKKEEKIQAS